MDPELFGDPQHLSYLMAGLKVDNRNDSTTSSGLTLPLNFGNFEMLPSPNRPEFPVRRTPRPRYTWGLVSSLPSSTTDVLGGPTNQGDVMTSQKTDVGDFSLNGVETDLTEQDLYQVVLRRKYALTEAPESDEHKVMVQQHHRPFASKSTTCVFCKNNGESLSVYGGHSLKDSFGRVTCPILHRYVCPVCGASGSQAHTLKYCPHNTTRQQERIDHVSRKANHSKGRGRDQKRLV